MIDGEGRGEVSGEGRGDGEEGSVRGAGAGEGLDNPTVRDHRAGTWAPVPCAGTGGLELGTCFSLPSSARQATLRTASSTAGSGFAWGSWGVSSHWVGICAASWNADGGRFKLGLLRKYFERGKSRGV